MKAALIGVVDYERGNLRSVAKALEAVGARVRVSASPRALAACQGLVLPGVGAFGDAMATLRRLKLDKAVLAFAASGKPLLGVCLGLQLFCDRSSEFGSHRGLGLFAGAVRRFKTGLKVPHMGWNQVRFKRACPLFKGLKSGEEFYFVHSYRARLKVRSQVAGMTRYGQEDFDSVLWRDQIFATQFHPEKSQKAGLHIYANFVKLAAKV